MNTEAINVIIASSQISHFFNVHEINVIFARQDCFPFLSESLLNITYNYIYIQERILKDVTPFHSHANLLNNTCIYINKQIHED